MNKINWQACISDFERKSSSLKTLANLEAYIAETKVFLKKLKEYNSDRFEQLMYESYVDKLPRRTILGEGISRIPRSETEVKVLVALLKNGLIVESAACISSYIDSSDLQHQMQIQQDYIPRSDFADTLVNFLVSLEPKTPELAALQDAIIHDPELAAMVVPNRKIYSIKEAATALHEDFAHLQTSGESHKAKTAILIRSFDLGIAPTVLENAYLRIHRSSSRIGIDAVTSAAFDLYEDLHSSEKSLTESQTILKHAALHCIDDEQLLNRFNQIFKPKQSIVEKANRVKLLRGYKDGRDLLNAFARKLQSEKSDKCDTLIDSIEEISTSYAGQVVENQIAQEEAWNFLNSYAKSLGLIEDVIPFRARKDYTPRVLGGKAEIIPFKKEVAEPVVADDEQLYKELFNKVVNSVVEDFIQQSNFVSQEDIEHIVKKGHGKELSEAGILISEIVKSVEKILQDNYNKTIISGISMLSESINHLTANRCRSSLCKLLRKYTDSSNISMLSNFESYEGKDSISLKLAVYDTSKKKLQEIKDRLTQDLIADGWMNKEDKFIKGKPSEGVMVVLHKIGKTFRSAAYKNREQLTLPIEIFGSKTFQII